MDLSSPSPGENVLMNLGQLEIDEINAIQGLERLKSAAAILDELHKKHPDIYAYRRDLAVTLQTMGQVFFDLRQWETAGDHLNRAAKHLEHLASNSPKKEVHQSQLRETRRLLSEIADKSD